MKAGEHYECPHCGQSTFLKKETLMDGWTKKGEILLCASCNTKVEDIAEDKITVSGEKKNGGSLDALSALLGGETVEKPTFETSEEEQRFCKNCKNFVSHPFMDRCSLHEKEVHPMDDCEDYAPKSNK